MVTDSLYSPYRKEGLATFQERLCPSHTLPFYGISVPNLRMLAKTVSFSDVDIVYHEDVILKGLALAMEKAPFSKKIERLNSLLSFLSAWDHTDTIASAFRPNRDNIGIMSLYFSSLLKKKETFSKRLGIVWLMMCRRVLDYERVLEMIVEADDESDYYVLMAVSWALSFYALDGRDISAELEKVSPTTKNKTLQKLRDSKRSEKGLSITRITDSDV